MQEQGDETYFVHVKAESPIAATLAARDEAAESWAANGCGLDDRADFAHLLILRGHHEAEPASER